MAGSFAAVHHLNATRAESGAFGEREQAFAQPAFGQRRECRTERMVKPRLSLQQSGAPMAFVCPVDHAAGFCVWAIMT